MNQKIQAEFNSKIFNNKEISLEAKGLYMVILENVDKYLDYKKIYKLSTNNRVTTQSIIIELVQNGFLFRKRNLDGNGRLINWTYQVYINDRHKL